MATTNGGILDQRNQEGAAKKALQVGLKNAIMGKATMDRFKEMLGKKAPGFLSSLLTVVNNSAILQKASTASILAAAGKAAALDLPIEPSLGQAYIVPYGKDAQFQIGYRGIIALAQRSGLMKSIVMTPVYKGEIQDWNRFTETYTQGERESDEVVGYFARFELINGFSKAAYWTKEAVVAHAINFNPMCKARGKLAGVWATNTDAMACKTVLMNIMKTYAPLSLEMQDAFAADEKIARVNTDGEEEFIDITPEPTPAAEPATVETDSGVVDTETGELFPKE